MPRIYRIICIVFIQLLYALTIGGAIVALHCGQLVIALLCAGASSLLRPLWEYVKKEIES